MKLENEVKIRNIIVNLIHIISAIVIFVIWGMSSVTKLNMEQEIQQLNEVISYQESIIDSFNKIENRENKYENF